MPLLSTVTTRSPAHRVVVAVMYLLLAIGSITMLYPFAIMLASSTANQYDYHDFSPLPRFLWNDQSLFLKTLYLREAGPAASKFGTKTITLEEIKEDPKSYIEQSFGKIFQRAQNDPQGLAKQIADWHAFLQSLPIEFIELHSADRYNELYPAFVQAVYLKKANTNDKTIALEFYNKEMQETHDNFATVNFWGGQGYPYQCYRPEHDVAFDLVQEFKRFLGPDYFTFTPTQTLWQAMLQQRYANVHAINAAWSTHYGDVAQIDFPLQIPTQDRWARDWCDFIVTRLPLLQQSIGNEFEKSFREYLHERFATEAEYRRVMGPELAAIDALPLPTTLPEHGALANVWAEFVAKKVPAASRQLHIPLVRYRQFLVKQYGSLNNAGKAYGLSWSDDQFVQLPFAEELVGEFTTHKTELRWHFLTGNYIRVLQFITTRGRALLNTAVLVVLTVLSALTVNPLAAYALSRYRMKSTPRILLFMLATMAFPAEVAMIPTFLLMRDLGLLNTFAALLVPGMANGFSIFLLKGFFDSLPKELYEAADLDGAGEVRKFLTITLPLSTPILAVIALGAFGFAYTSFMWGLVICPDSRMWTIMVWLFAFQGEHGTKEPYLVMASFVVASLPPLIMFLLCQRVILRGIMIPEMK